MDVNSSVYSNKPEWAYRAWSMNHVQIEVNTEGENKFQWSKVMAMAMVESEWKGSDLQYGK